MRAPSDMPPPRRPRKRRLLPRGRVILILVAVGLFVLITSLRGIAGFYTDYLWFESLGNEDTFRTILGAKASLALIFIGVFFVLCYVNLVIADRIAPRFRPMGPEEELLRRYHEIVDERSGRVRVGVCLLFALIAGGGVSSQWNDWLLFTNRVDFGIQDPQFHTDIGFYVFQLPFGSVQALASTDNLHDIGQALLALGYNDKEAAAALKALPADMGVSEGIKLALKSLNR